MQKPYFSVSREPYSNRRPQKITQRAIRQSEFNPSQENAVKEEQAIQSLYEQKRQNYSEFERKAMTKLYGTPEEKAELARMYHEELREHYYAKIAQEDAEKAEEARIERDMVERARYEQIMEREQEQAKKEYMAYLAACEEEQLRQKEERKLQEKYEEDTADRSRPEFFGGHFGKSLR